MTSRLVLVLVAGFATPAVSLAQGFSQPLPTPPPVPIPGSPLPFPAASPFTPPNVVRPWVRPLPWWYAPIINPGPGYAWTYWGPTVPTPGWTMGSIAAPTPPPLVGAGGPGLNLSMTELTASYTIDFPAEVTLTLNGEAVPGSGRTRVLTSPPLKAGSTVVFVVRAEWTQDGQRYEWDRTLTLGPGDKSRATVLRGFRIPEQR